MLGNISDTSSKLLAYYLLVMYIKVYSNEKYFETVYFTIYIDFLIARENPNTELKSYTEHNNLNTIIHVIFRNKRT